MNKVFVNKKDFTACAYKSNGNTIIMWEYEPSMMGGSEAPFGKCYKHKFNYIADYLHIRQYILDFYDIQAKNEILSGMEWDNHTVWLSSENQANYKAMYDLAVQTDGANLPAKIKLGEVDNPHYCVFNTLDEVKAFYLAEYKHIQGTLEKYWEIKDKIDWEQYKK